jgi:VCBS repeat-containing protein
MKIIKQAGLLCLPILLILLVFPFVANEVPISSTTRENLLKLSSSRIDSPSQGGENNFGIDFYDSTLFESIKNHLKNFVSSSDLNIDTLFSGNGKNNLGKEIRFRSVIDEFQHNGFDLDLRLLPSQDMHHLMAAFTADGPFGRPAIFLNETYFTQSSFEWKQRVLLEEIGHYIDYELNETEDTAGDEGALFAAAVLGLAYDKSTAERLATQNDQIKIEIYEQIFSLELASLLFTTQQAYEIGALATLEQNSFTLTAALGAAGSRYLFVSDPPSAEFFSGNNVRGRLYVVNASNQVDAEYFGEISRLVKTGSRVDALQFYVYPIAPPADRQTPGQTIIIPIVDSSVRTFSIGQTLGSSSDPVGPALNELLAVSQPEVVRPTAKDAIESGGVANAILGTNPTGHIFTDGDITNPYTNYTIDTSVTPNLMVAASGGAMQVTDVSNSLGTSSAAGTPINGQYGSLTLNADGSYTYTLDNTNPAVEALRTSTNTLEDQFTYRVEDGTSFVVNTMVITIEGRNDNPIANDDYNVAKESLIEDGQANQYTSLDPLGRKLLVIFYLMIPMLINMGRPKQWLI